MMREDFLRNEITFLTELLAAIQIKYKDTSKFINEELKKRIEINREQEKELQDPNEVLSNILKETYRSKDR